MMFTRIQPPLAGLAYSASPWVRNRRVRDRITPGDRGNGDRGNHGPGPPAIRAWCWRRTSYIRTPAATAAFSDVTCPSIGMLT